MAKRRAKKPEEWTKLSADERDMIASFAGAPHPIALPNELQRSFYRTLSGILRNPSMPYWKDRTLHRQMRNDPDIDAPLYDLYSAVSQLEGQFEATDDGQDEQIAFLDDVLDEFPHFTDFKTNLCEGVWYGAGANNVVYGARDGDIVPVSWMPLHSDSLAFTMEGKLGLRVNSMYQAENVEKCVQGFDSPVRMLSDEERQTVVLYVHNRRAPDFDDPLQTAYPYAGRGIRDVAWFYWMMKQECLQNWAGFCHRYAMGIRKGYYPRGVEGAREAMQQLLDNLMGDVAALLPRDAPDKNDFDVEVMEVQSARATHFKDLCEWLTANIKERIVGQLSTSEGGAGAGVAKQHAHTFNRHMKYVADGLQEAISRELVRPLIDWNYGKQKRYPKFRFSVEKPDVYATLQAIAQFVQLGGEVPESDVRGIIGIRTPEEGEAVLSLANMLPGFGTGGGLSQAPNMRQAGPDATAIGRTPTARDGGGLDKAQMRRMFDEAAKVVGRKKKG